MQTQMQAGTEQNPIQAINDVIKQIMSSVNPQEMFNKICANNQDAKNAVDLINKYGNGDPRSAFMNMMVQEGKQNLGQQIMQRLNLHF